MTDTLNIHTLIVPGLNGSPEGHWQHIWANEVAGAETVEQENWSEPNLADWLHALEARLEATPPGVVLVAHSLGCSLVAALAGRPAAAHVSGALLVAPADLETLSDRFPETREFASAHEVALPFASIVVASRNDPFMAFEAAEAQALRWGSAFFDLGEAGHINIASGFGRWEDGFVLAEGLHGRLCEEPTAFHAPLRGQKGAASGEVLRAASV